MPTLPFVAALAAGVSAAALAWWLAMANRRRAAGDRRLPRPSTHACCGYVWWPGCAGSPTTWRPPLPLSVRQRDLSGLRRAGLDYAVSPEQFVAARLLGAVTAALRRPQSWSQSRVRTRRGRSRPP
jgi:tight adherence protein C